MELAATRSSLPPEAGDFASLLRERGLYPQIANTALAASASTPGVQTQATTICAFKFAGWRARRRGSSRHGGQCGGLRSRG
ncbi:MAG: hypothetical protein WDN28_11755 [Chthoniobacter sp.]